jgi:cobalt/nickel transport system ATP-binding protein
LKHSAPTPPQEPALAVSKLCFSYPDRPGVLQDVDLSVLPGERVGLIGPNGAGKTTLFLLSCGVLKPESGNIALFGEPLAHRGFRPEIGMVFQNSDDQLFSPSVRDDVAFGPQNLGLSKEEIAARVEGALSITGVSDLAQRPPHHLSGGEKRMVSIAGVLAMRPRLVIYDEPSANLDIRARRRLIRFLQASQETLLIASHDLELVLEVCGRVVLLDQGRIVANGDPRETMGDVALMEAHGLERPHSLVPHAGSDHHRRGVMEKQSPRWT